MRRFGLLGLLGLVLVTVGVVMIAKGLRGIRAPGRGPDATGFQLGSLDTWPEVPKKPSDSEDSGDMIDTGPGGTGPESHA